MPRPSRSFPQNKAELKNRIAVGNTVVDHELVIRAPGGEEFEIIAIYSFKDGLISRVDFAKVRPTCRSAALPRPISSPPASPSMRRMRQWAQATIAKYPQGRQARR